MSEHAPIDAGAGDAAERSAWEERLAGVRGVHSIEPGMPGLRRYPNIFAPRRIGGRHG